MADHVHMMLSIPPKYSVSWVNERPSVKTFLMAFGSVDASYRFSYDK
jgi:REP element-mobilizing transposase RayT